ncbi:flagellar filament capping protein FliD [Paenibacillus sp. FSL P4-0081]|uniref:flagellar filament capping protein FliD n=1 Tax=Paenibacillus sp. FSL P4-0081 TaxID=1536769 RepID=UPI000A8A3141|nr:flagellar filament capping protein FliD [Paenibacillus sp. FSL P4-0081]
MVTRVNGFSGMDIDSMVKNMMTAKRAPLDKLNQQKILLNWTRDSYREVNSKLVDFRTNKLTDKYGVSSALNSQKATVTGNTSAVKVDATADSNGTPMTVEVKELATKSSFTTGVLQTAGSPSSMARLSTTLGDLFGTGAPESFDLYINKTTITFKASDTISSVISKINGDKTANVKATFDDLSGKFTVVAKDYGTTNNIILTDKNGETKTSNPFLGLLGITSSKIIAATNAEIVVTNTSDPTAAQTYYPENNKVTVNGVVITAQVRSNGENSKITTETDPTVAVTNIKAFIEDYNTLIGSLNSLISEEKYRDYAPLTDEQKADMKETDITNWTEKAKSGLLKNDDIIKQALSSMREMITDKLGVLSAYGITTGSYFDKGKLVLDETKLKQAIANNPQGIQDILQGPSSATDSGLFDTLAKKIDGSLDLLNKRAGTDRYSTDITTSFKTESVMGKKLKEYNTRISSMLTMLDNAETRYYKQFTAMETAMSKLQSQSSNLFSTSS